MGIEAALAALPEFRRMAEARMLSRATVRRKTGAMVKVAGLNVPEWAVTITGLPVRLDSSSQEASRRSVTIGGVTYESATALGHFPASTVNLSDDDLVEVVSGEWPGTVWRIIKTSFTDQKTALRLPLEQVARPAEWT